MYERIKEAITEHFGERCDPPMLNDPEAKCDVCEAWREFDELMAIRCSPEEIRSRVIGAMERD